MDMDLRSINAIPSKPFYYYSGVSYASSERLVPEKLVRNCKRVTHSQRLHTVPAL